MSATIMYTDFDANNDPVVTNNLGDLLTDSDAVAQIVRTSLLLFEGEWWEDLTDGLPLWQSMLGAPGVTSDQLALLIQNRVLSRPNVSGMSQVSAAFNRAARQFAYSAQVQTTFGTTILVTNTPTPPPQGLPG